MPLSFAKNGCEVTIKDYRASGDVKRHLESLGFTVGQRITPIAVNAGNLIVRIREARVALNMGTASQIIVEQ